MTASRRIAAVVAAFLALSPAAALAQGSGAGDEQYSDPFAETTPSTTKPKPQTSAPSTPQQQAAPSTSTSATPQSTAPAPAPQSSGQLPRTGFDVIPLALLGVALIGAGVLLLRRRRA